jgi:hypothetical protein
MSSMKFRLHALEARQRRQHRPGEHFTSIVRVPQTVPHDGWLDWLASQPCACGQTYCDQRRVGALLPEPCETPEAWAARYGRARRVQP